MVGNKSCEVNIIRQPFPNAYFGQLMKQNPSVIWNENFLILYIPRIYIKMAWLLGYLFEFCNENKIIIAFWKLKL